MSLRVAVASSDSKFINQHFGHAEQFLIFDIDDKGKFEYVELRKNEPTCSGGDHTPNAMEKTLNLLNGVDIVLVAQIGPGASHNLSLNGIKPIIDPSFINDALSRLVSKNIKMDL